MSKLSTTAEDILACARTLIVDGGYNGFSYADIAKVVGIRKASIHHHFPTKADLVCALIARYREETEAGLKALEHHTSAPLEMLHAYTGYWATCISSGSAPFCVCALLASQLPALPGEVALEVKAHFKTLSAWLTAAFERGAKDGSLSLSDTPGAEAEMLLAAVHGAMLSARAHNDPQMFSLITQPLLKRITP